MSFFLHPKTRKRVPQCASTHVVPELATFLGRKNIDLLAWLTDWYDCKSPWINDTKTAGVDKIDGMCYNFLGATAPDWLDEMLPQEAVGGGFTSRCILVCEDRKRKLVIDPRPSKEELEIRKSLISDLRQVRLISGPMTVTEEAYVAYEAWYRKQEANIIDGAPPILDPRFQGYISRRQIHCWKLSMVMSISRGESMVIELPDFLRAVALLEATERKMPYAFRGYGRARYSRALDLVLRYLDERGQAKHSELLRIHRFDLDAYTLDIVIDNLLKMHVISKVRDSRIGDTTYTYLDKGGKV